MSEHDRPVSDLSEAYRGRTVAITGHTGFKGSWLATWLDELGARVVGLSDRVPERGAFHDLGVEGFADSRVVDVRDLEGLAASVADASPDVVFHLAAQPLVRASWNDRASTFATNVMGTVHAVEAALACPTVEAIVVVTTDKVYENRGEGRPFLEDDRLGGHDPYSASKSAAELVLAPYRDAAHMGFEPRPIVSVRAGNVIGGGDWSEDRLLPDVVRALRAGEPIVIRRPDAVRPWQHVLDCLWGYLLLGASILEGRAVASSYNLAHPVDDVSVLGVVQRALAAWGADPELVVVDRDDSTAEAAVLRLDAGRAAADLGWRPKWSVDRSVEEAIRFYLADDPPVLGRRQIAEHAASPTLAD